jgi:tetratricopeptide (TPR) repeat protein
MSNELQPAPDAVLLQTRRRRRRVFLLSLFVVILAIGAGFGYSYYHAAETLRAALPEWPPAGEDGIDRLVRKAIEDERAKVNQHPFTSAAWGRLGMVYYAHSYESDAAACFVQAERLDPKEARWHYLHGVILIHTDPDSALAEIERAADLCDDTNLVPRIRLGEYLLKANRLDEAEHHFLIAVNKDKDKGNENPRAHLGLARVYFKRGDLENSLEQVKYSVNAPIGQRGSHDLLTELYNRLGNTALALEHQKAAENVQRRTWPDPYVDEANHMQTGLPRFLETSGNLLLENRASDALKVLQKTTHTYPESERAWFLTARARALETDWSGAEQAARRAIAISPDFAEGQYFLGVILSNKREYRAAMEHFAKAIDLKPAFAEAHYQMGLCRDQVNERKGAIDAFETALRNQPEMLQARRALGESLLAAGEPLVGLVHLQIALRSKPDDEKTKELIKKGLPQVCLPIVR